MEVETVEIQKLLLNTKKLNQGFFAFEIDPSQIEQFEHNDLINDWHIEHIRRFNATAEYLARSLHKVHAFGMLLSKGVLISTENGILIDVQKEHRIACRDAFMNIDVYIEAVKAFCRYYFFMDPKQTDDGVKWYQAMLQYKALAGWDYIERFLSQCDSVKNDKTIQFLTQVRNNEVHSESPIELIRYSFDKNMTPIPQEYVISNQHLHNRITHAALMLVTLAQRLQDVIDHISPGSLYGFLKDKNGQLINIIRIEDRYKRERVVFSTFANDEMP